MSTSGIFPSDEWAALEGDTPEGKMFLRFRTGDPAEETRAPFTTLIKVRWVYVPKDISGLPSAETIAQMDEFEERAMTASDTARNWGSCAAVITHRGVREWRFYTPNAGVFQTELTEALTGLGPYPLQFEVFEDPDWQGLAEIRNFAGLTKQA